MRKLEYQSVAWQKWLRYIESLLGASGDSLRESLFEGELLYAIIKIYFTWDFYRYPVNNKVYIFLTITDISGVNL